MVLARSEPEFEPRTEPRTEPQREIHANKKNFQRVDAAAGTCGDKNCTTV